MKQLDYFINEKLKINSNSKINPTAKKIANYLNIEEKYAKEIEDKYLNKKFFINLEEGYDKTLYASDFELVFMLAIMLIDDNKDYLDILDLGYNTYKGNNNPYDYSWYEDEFTDQNKHYDSVLDYIQEQFRNSKEFRELFKEVYDFCKKANINNPEKFFDIYEYI